MSNQIQGSGCARLNHTCIQVQNFYIIYKSQISNKFPFLLGNYLITVQVCHTVLIQLISTAAVFQLDTQVGSSTMQILFHSVLCIDDIREEFCMYAIGCLIDTINSILALNSL